MIEITKSAQEYFARLITQQEMDDIGLHLSVLKPGSPLASCDLQFHVPGQSGEKELDSGFRLCTFIQSTTRTIAHISNEIFSLLCF